MQDQLLDISVVIITFNEEDNIERCLQHVTWAKEIIIVDSFSTDRTVEIAKTYTNQIVSHPFEGHVQQKNYALRLASYEWVLALDADEVVTSELLEKIRTIWSKEKDQYDGFTVNRKSQFIGKWIHHCGWYPDRKLRLFRQNKGVWGGENPHDKIILDGKIKNLDADILHYTYYSLAENIDRIQKYTSIAAQAKYEKRKRASLLDLLFRPPLKFIKSYLIQQGFRDGMHGLVLCMVAAFYVFLKYAKLWELGLDRDEVE